MLTIAELRKTIARRRSEIGIVDPATVHEYCRDMTLLMNLLDDLAQHIERLEATAPSDPLGSPDPEPPAE